MRPRFEFVYPWDDGSATVKVADAHSRKLQVGLIDVHGNEIIPFGKFEFVRALAPNLYAVRQGGKWGLANGGGCIIFEPTLDAINASNGDVFEARSSGRRFGLTREGSIVAHPDEGRVIKACPRGLKLISREGSYQLVGPEERPLTPILDGWMQLECEKPSSFRVGGKVGFIKPDGQLLYEQPRFTNAWGFSEGIAIVQEDGRWGLVDETGAFVLQPTYESLIPLTRWSTEHMRRMPTGLYNASLDGRDIIIDRHGVEQPPPSFRQPFRDRIDCGQGIALKDHNDLWGIVDESDAFIVPPVYRALGYYRRGIAWGADDVRRKWRPIGFDGKVREGLPLPRKTWFPTWVSHHWYETLHEDQYENSVLWTRQYYEYLAGRREDAPRIVGDGTQAHGTRSIFQ